MLQYIAIRIMMTALIYILAVTTWVLISIQLAHGSGNGGDENDYIDDIEEKMVR